jgi:hypothetical protein
MGVREDAVIIMNYEVMASLASWTLRRYQGTIYSFTGVFFLVLGQNGIWSGIDTPQRNYMNALRNLFRQLPRGT